MNNSDPISIHDFKTKYLRKYYGSSRNVYRASHVDRVLGMYADLHYLRELKTRTQLVPCNEEFLKMKAIPSYNRAVLSMQKRYPNIIEFQRYKLIES